MNRNDHLWITLIYIHQSVTEYIHLVNDPKKWESMPILVLTDVDVVISYNHALPRIYNTYATHKCIHRLGTAIWMEMTNDEAEWSPGQCLGENVS